MTRVGDHGGTAGFSLVEMLVVLAILGLVAISAGPSLDALIPARSLGRTIQALSGEIDLLRADALRQGRPARLVFEGASNRFVSSRPGAPPISIAAFATRVDVPRTAWEAPGEIRFLFDGSSSGGVITLDYRGVRRVLTVSRLTGLAHPSETTP